MATDVPPQDATKRLQTKKQTLDDAYAPPANYLEIDVGNPTNHGVARKRYTDYEVRMRVSQGSQPYEKRPIAIHRLQILWLGLHSSR